jgi:hypothetical protein
MVNKIHLHLPDVAVVGELKAGCELSCDFLHKLQRQTGI